MCVCPRCGGSELLTVQRSRASPQTLLAAGCSDRMQNDLNNAVLGFGIRILSDTEPLVVKPSVIGACLSEHTSCCGGPLVIYVHHGGSSSQEVGLTRKSWFGADGRFKSATSKIKRLKLSLVRTEVRGKTIRYFILYHRT